MIRVRSTDLGGHWCCKNSFGTGGVGMLDVLDVLRGCGMRHHRIFLIALQQRSGKLKRQQSREKKEEQAFHKVAELYENLLLVSG